MLADAMVCATLPTADLERARRFYGGTLGLPEEAMGVEGGAFYRGGGGTLLRVYERPPSAADHTLAVFLVDDLEAEMSVLRERGVVFEEYDMPGLTTEEGVHTDERTGFKGAWLRDPDGNTLGITQLLRTPAAVGDPLLGRREAG